MYSCQRTEHIIFTTIAVSVALLCFFRCKVNTQDIAVGQSLTAYRLWSRALVIRTHGSCKLILLLLVFGRHNNLFLFFNNRRRVNDRPMLVFFSLFISPPVPSFVGALLAAS